MEAKTLCKSIEANGWWDRVHVDTMGLWSDWGFMAAFDGPRPAKVFPTNAHGLSYDEQVKARDVSKAAALEAIKDQPGHVSVLEVRPLDSYGEHRVDWLKIDTEGCELEILKGGINTLKKHKPRIILEHHYHIDPDCESKCDAFLAELGYTKVGTRPHHSIAHSLYTHPEGR